MQRLLVAIVLPLAAASLGCDAAARSPVAYGQPTAVIVSAPPQLWAAVEDSVRTALEPMVFTVRDERAYDLTYVEPNDPAWQDFRMWRNIMVIGTAESPWVAAVLEDADTVPPTLPALVSARSIWARGQTVTAVVLPEEGAVEALSTLLPDIRRDIQGRFRDYVLRRMYVSGVDEGLRERLAEAEGFSLMVPDVYRHTEVAPHVHIVRNDFPDPSTLVRSILVTWREGTPDTVTAELALAWRDTVEEAHYQRPMDTLRDPIQVEPAVADAPGPSVEVHGIWQSPPGGFPGGGPFITQVIVCPEQERTYLLDAWLYAPGKDKYEYILQLEALLSTFRCGAAAGEPLT